MGRFTELTENQVAELIGQFGAGEVKSYRPLAAGTINSNFEVLTDVERFFMRVNEGKSAEQVEYEAALVRELAERGVHTPLPWKSKGSDERRYAELGDKQVSLFQWISGEHRVEGDIGMSDCEQVGAALAGLHLAGEGLDARYQQPGIYTFDAIVERFNGFRDSDDKKLAEAIEVIGDEIAWLSPQQAERDAAPKGIIHADLFPDNVLFHDQGVTLLDFEQACWGSFVYDLAVTLNAWCFDKRFRKNFVKELVAGYRAVRPLSPAELALLYVEARAAAMRFTVTRITDVYLPGIDLEDKDFRDYLARLTALRETEAEEFAGWHGAM